MENIRKYGVLVDLASHFRGDINPNEWPSVLTVLALGGPIVLALLLEQVALRQVQSGLRHHRAPVNAAAAAQPGALIITPVPFVSALQMLNVLVVIVVPVVSVRTYRPAPVAALIVMFLAIILACVWPPAHPNPGGLSVRSPAVCSFGAHACPARAARSSAPAETVVVRGRERAATRNL